MSEEKELEKKYTRQEQEPATKEITEIAPGILRSQLPVELPGLGHVNCYLLEDEKGLAIVDPGLPGPKSFEDLNERLKLAGYGIENVHTIIVTHSHFDHFGGAERVREETGAEIVTHKNFRVMWAGKETKEMIGGAEDEGAESEGGEDEETQNAKTPWGTTREFPGSKEDRNRWREMGREEREQWFRTPEPTIHLVDSQIIKLARREWVAVHTPGHTADHLCLYDPEHGVMLSGDHVLPTITPHIAGMAESHDPLADFFDSLKRMGDFKDAKVALPAHGHPFENLVGRSNDIIAHHKERLDVIRKSAEELGDGTVVDYMERLFKPRSWGMMAESETFSHLKHLEKLGEVAEGEKEGLTTFRLIDSG